MPVITRDTGASLVHMHRAKKTGLATGPCLFYDMLAVGDLAGIYPTADESIFWRWHVTVSVCKPTMSGTLSGRLALGLRNMDHRSLRLLQWTLWLGSLILCLGPVATFAAAAFSLARCTFCVDNGTSRGHTAGRT